MAPLDYWLMRTLRRSLPENLVAFIHDHGIFRTPGQETRLPEKTARWYAKQLEKRGYALDGKTVCVVGFGGSFGTGIHLLELGARRVILQDPFAPIRPARNAAIPEALRDKYFTVDGDNWLPDHDRLLVLRDHLEPYAIEHPGSVDFVLSRAVLEHVDDVESLVRACCRLTRPDGLNIHLIDLRDHYFKHPFEMLCYTETTWRRWLNASNNLNRWRLPNYELTFGKVFGSVEVEILDCLREAFCQARPRVRPEFLTGDEDVDAAARVLVTARHR
jgi:SAM-dependent methyltransferase